ncbi:MAG: hypothetical protein JNM67_00830 [Bacteroidetes bacterium]|nr:hypothetical protein [Bacteroidota bacterium]
MNEITEIVIWFLLSGVKYLFAAGPLLLNSSRAWYFDMLIVSSGGTLGVFVFTYLGAALSKYLGQFHLFKFKYKKLKKFVQIKNSYGLIGIAIISPALISIPVGCIISASFEHNKSKIIRYQVGSVVLWSLVLFGLKGIFNITLIK